MSKVVILSSKAEEIDGKKYTKIEVLKQVKDKIIFKPYYLSEANKRGFKPDMVADLFGADEFNVYDADFEEVPKFGGGTKIDLIQINGVSK